MAELKVDLTITIDTALSVGTGGGTGRADVALLRDGWGRPIIPGSQLKGRLRHACEQLARGLGLDVCHAPNPRTTCPHDPQVTDVPCVICQIFGCTTYPAPLRFQDLVYDTGLRDDKGSYHEHEVLRPGIGVARRTRTVQENLLFLRETTAPGEQPGFHSLDAIVGDLPAGDAGRRLAYLLLLGLKKIPAWGGAKSRGLGWGTVDYQMKLGGQDLTLDPKEVQRVWTTE